MPQYLTIRAPVISTTNAGNITKIFVYKHCFCYLRPGDCKYRELIFKTVKADFFIFCQEKPFGELFLKIRLKLAREFLIVRNPTKSRIAVFALRPQ